MAKYPSKKKSTSVCESNKGTFIDSAYFLRNQEYILYFLTLSSIPPVHPKGDQSWVFVGRTDVEAETPILWPPDEELTHWKRPWCWERLRAGGEGDGRGWDGWMASLTQWTWVWVNSGSWWWTGRPGVLQFMGLQRVGHDWVTELNWTNCLELGVMSNWDEGKHLRFVPLKCSV